jgi:hypothetical protein
VNSSPGRDRDRDGDRDGDGAAQTWAAPDEPWREAFRQAWQALRSGNFPVGACASTRGGEIVHSARNRVNDADGPRGEIFGSAGRLFKTRAVAS